MTFGNNFFTPRIVWHIRFMIIDYFAWEHASQHKCLLIFPMKQMFGFFWYFGKFLSSVNLYGASCSGFQLCYPGMLFFHFFSLFSIIKVLFYYHSQVVLDLFYIANLKFHSVFCCFYLNLCSIFLIMSFRAAYNYSELCFRYVLQRGSCLYSSRSETNKKYFVQLRWKEIKNILSSEVEKKHWWE